MGSVYVLSIREMVLLINSEAIIKAEEANDNWVAALRVSIPENVTTKISKSCETFRWRKANFERDKKDQVNLKKMRILIVNKVSIMLGYIFMK